MIKIQLQLHIGFGPIVHLAAPWRRMPVVLKEDLGLSSLGLTGSRGMLQYGVAFMKIISRRSNDRLFDNPICGETYMTIVKFSESRHSTKPRFVVRLGLQYLYLFQGWQKCLIFLSTLSSYIYNYKRPA